MGVKKILFISQHFTPEFFRGNDIAADWARRGYDVTVVTGIPNYPKGKFFDGYGLFKRHREVVDGVKVIRVPIVPRGNGSKVMLLLNFLSYGFNASVFLCFHLIRHKYDVCFVQQTSPVNMALPGIWFKRLTGKPLYSWVLDMWPESLKYAGHVNNKLILGYFGNIALQMFKASDKILISSRGFEKCITARGDFSDKIVYFPNWAEDVFSDNSSSETVVPALPEGFKVLFAGNVGEAQDFEHIAEAAEMLGDDEGIRFVIVGNGRKKVWLDQRIAERGLANRIVTLGRFPAEAMPLFFKAADVMLVSLCDNELFRLTAPAKIQAYMAAGKPIVGMISGEGNAFIKDSGCGVAVEAGDAAGLVDAIRSLMVMPPSELAEMGRRGREYCHHNFDKKMLMDRLCAVMGLER